MTTEPKTTGSDTAPPLITPRADYEMNTTVDDSSKVMLAATIVILVVALAGGIIAITPQVKNMAAQKEKIADLEAQLAAAKQNPPPSPSEERLNEKIQRLSDQVEQFKASVAGADVQAKLSQLETKFDQVVQQTHSLGLSSLMTRLQSLQQSPEGAAMISNLVASLAGAPADSDAGENLARLRAADPGVAQITEGVAPEDMKAAAMLIAMSQMRSALMRDNASFDTDLALLKRTLPKDDPELVAAIDRLAPQAKYGVLTPTGLSQEFRGMTGDIVSASLSGSDVSIREKAKARLADVFMVEKNGKRISGTDAQIAVSAAQKQLDAGNVEGAVEILQTLKGPAAVKTQPFVEQAQATIMAGNLQNLLSQNIVQNVKVNVGALIHGMPGGIVNPVGLPAITSKIKEISSDMAPGIVPSVTTPVH